MPYVNIRITPEEVTATKKAALIYGVTDLLHSILNKRPETTFVVIDEVDPENWGIGGVPVEEFRKRSSSESVTASRDHS
jgi:4-oxalocrotonate tautomerase